MNISIIGAGPAGCIAALHSKGHDVTLYEEHRKQPVQCAGLISISGLKRLGIKPEFLSKVRGAKIYSPLKKLLEIEAKKDKAYVVDRQRFDEDLLNCAIDSGAEFINERVDDLNNLKADRIVLATGTNYQLHRKLKLEMPRHFLVGAQYDLKLDCDPDFVELHFNVPGFFSWVIPAGDYCRVGLCARENPTPWLDRFVKELREDGRIKNSRILNKNYGTIPLYNPRIKTDYGKIITVGDSAGHVKATTGGGVVMGGLAAEHACKKDYEKLWRAEIGRELRLHLLVRNFLDKLSSKNTDRLFSMVADHKDSLEKRGDMDLASRSISSLLRNPSFTFRLLLNSPLFLLDML